MPQIVQQGSVNTTALVVPDLYVQIVPPQNLVLNGVPTNVLGVVGTATWGPSNTAVTIGTMAAYSQQFGAIQNRKYDMGTAVAVAVQQGATNFRCVRVTDGTDTAATVSAGLLGMSFTALYTGTLGNSLTVQMVPGTAAGSYKIIVSLPGFPSEVYDNITGTGATFYTNAAAAVNNGDGILRPPSLLVTAAAGTATQAPTGTITAVTKANPCVITVNNNYAVGQTINVTGVTSMTQLNGGPYTVTAASSTSITLGAVNSTAFTTFTSGGSTILANASTALAGGTDGVATLTAAVLVGQNTVPYKGMYCLQNQGVSVAMLADADDSTQWTTQQGFGLANGIYMMLVAPAGSAITNGINGTVDLVTSTGMGGTYSAKVLHGDWIYWNDPVNQVLRLVSPQGFAAGRLANLSPQNSSLNKPLYGIVGSQKSGIPGIGQMATYAEADLQNLFSVGVDVICNPQPGGSYWGLRLGHNTSSNAATNGDNYVRMTNYIAATIAAGMGAYVGQVINSTLFTRITSTLNSFFQNLLQQGLLGSLDGSLPFSVICNLSNNPFSQTSIGIVQANCQVQSQAINEKFLVNIEGGQTVVVSKQTTSAGQSVG